jgi:hypothetical protein
MPPDINVALLYTDIGQLKAQSEERSKQTDELFKLIREMSAKMATKDDIKELTLKVESGHLRIDNLHDRVAELENDRKWVKTGVRAAIGLPPLLAALAEDVRFLIGHPG